MIVDGESPADLAAALVQLGASQAVVKLGANGCVAVIDGTAFAEPAIAITPVDTVGAGDAFVAGYLAELLAGSDAAERLAVAVRCGAFACLGAGDWESFPTRTDLSLLDGGDPVRR
jgi:2-dehydro-3-deoxygluconokinase